MSAHPAPALDRPLCISQMIESDGPGGAEVLLLRLAVELRRRGHTVVPVGPERGIGWLGARLSENGFDMRTFRMGRSMIDIKCVLSMRDMLRAEGVDVVHGHDFDMCVYGTAAARLLRIPNVTTMHGNYTTKTLKRRVALRWAFAWSGAAITVSQATKASFDDALGVRPGLVEVIHNGVPAVVGERNPVRAEFGIRENEILLLTLGTVCEGKGQAVLIDALRGFETRGVRAPWRVIVAGQSRDGETERLQRVCADAGFADRVHFAGHRSDIGNLLTAADIFVMPSLWEGLPLALLEAMNARKPIIASNVGGIPEAITDGVDGALVPPRDANALGSALAQLLADASLRQRLATAARQRSEREFTIEAMADRYERLYARVLHARTR